MVEGTSALNIQEKEPALVHDINGDVIWTLDQHSMIVQKLLHYGCEYLKGREEYTLLKEVVASNKLTGVLNSRQIQNCINTVTTRAEDSGVILPYGDPVFENDTTQDDYRKPFLAQLNIQKAGSISDVLPSFKAVQSKSMSLNIGFDTEFKDYRDRENTNKNRRLLSLQMTISVGDALIRYFFLVDPRFQEVTKDGGQIPLKYCLADILSDLKKSYFPEFPLVRKEDIVYKEKPWKGHPSYKYADFKAMEASIIPVTLICHTGKADISVFRRSKYDIDLLRELNEIEKGWMTLRNIPIKAENDAFYNYYWLLKLCVRDTLGLTPADNKVSNPHFKWGFNFHRSAV